MTTQEFSDLFDVLYNNITSNQAPGLNEYEKSVFLTKALDEIVLTYFNLFDVGAKIQADFSNLIRTIVMEKADSNFDAVDFELFDPRATLFYIPNEFRKNNSEINDSERGETNFDNVLIIINEQLILYKETEDNSFSRIPNGIRQVIPLPYDLWTLFMSKPYKYPNKYLAWRLLEGRYETDLQSQIGDEKIRRVVSIVLNPADKSSDKIEYRLRYVKKPRPIILTTFTEDDGVSFSTDHTYTDKTECELDPIVHHQILERAVELAKAAWAVLSKQPLNL